MTADEPINGKCLCGAVKFQIETPVKFTAHCHCSLCRRAHGAAFVTWTGVMKERFQLLAGDDLVASYHSTPEATRSFCRQCGSSLFFESTRWAGEIHVAVANLDRLPAPIQAHVFYSDRADWVVVADGLPHLGGASGVEPLSPSA